jgi:CDP-glycerol glycerophosphotransferase (TagB/SpsB family)
VLSTLRRLRPVRAVVRRVGVHRVSALVGLAQLPLLKVVEVVLRRFPRDRRLVVLGSPLDRFSDNAAYLFLHLSERPSTLRPVWITGSADLVRRLRARGYRVESRWSWKGVVTTLRAGTFAYSGYRSDINSWLSPGAVTLCLWHGLPIKRIERAVRSDVAHRDTPLRRLLAAAHEAPPDFLLSSTDFTTEVFSAAFGVPPERCWQLGYPRNDHLLADPGQRPHGITWHDEVWDRLSSAGRVVGLFLTWRDDRVDDLVDQALIRRLVETCARHGAVLAYKAHYNVAPAGLVPEQCVVLPADEDLHAYLGLCDVLITDYSSVALDFLLLRRPVVYFMPDLEHYAATRGFTVDPLALPGTVTLDSTSLVRTLDTLLANPASWSWGESDESFLHTMWGSYSGSAAPALVDALLAALRSADRGGDCRVNDETSETPPPARGRPRTIGGS